MLVQMSAWLLEVFPLESVGVGPDVSEADGRMEAEEDDERNTYEGDDAPRPLAVVLCVGRHSFRLLHLNTQRIVIVRIIIKTLLLFFISTT